MEIEETFSTDIFNEITWGIISLIPLDINSMIFSGGLVFDAYWKQNFNQSMQWDNTQVRDIDLFLFGSAEKKVENILTVINILNTRFGYDRVCVGLNGAVITILIVGIPRIVQITCTDKWTANEVIYDFDLAHVMLYISNEGLYVSPFALVSMEMREILPNPKSKKTAKMSRLAKYQEKGLGIGRYINEYPFIFEDEYKADLSEVLTHKYKQTNNLETIGDKLYYILIGPDGEKKKIFRTIEMFDNLGFVNQNEITHIQEFKIDKVNLSGDFEYLGGPEPFLYRDFRVLKSENTWNNKDCEYAKLYKYNIPEQFSKRYRHRYLIDGEIVCYQYNKDFNEKHYQTFNYQGPHVVVLAIDNPQAITNIKTHIRMIIESLGEQKPWATTCLFDSRAIEPEEKEYFCVSEINRPAFFKEVMYNFVESDKLYIGVSGYVNYNWSRRKSHLSEGAFTNPKYWIPGSRLQIIGDWEATIINKFLTSFKNNVACPNRNHTPCVYFAADFIVKTDSSIEQNYKN